MLALHAAGGVDGDGRRRAWKTSPDFPGLADELAEGAPLDPRLFLLLGRREGRA